MPIELEAAETGPLAALLSDNATALWVYDGSLHVAERADGTCATYIGEEQVSGPQEILERELFLRWYCSECAKVYTSEQLSGLLEVWCEHHGVEPASADEILADVSAPPPEQRTDDAQDKAAWLQWFIWTWEETQDAEQAARSNAPI